MPDERRENDKIILDRLEKIQDSQTKFEVNLALNTKSTNDIEEHLRILNGKVITNQNSIQALQASDVLKTAFIKKLDDTKEKESERKYETHDRWKWVVVGLSVSIGGQILLYLIQSDALKRIFTN